MRYVAMLVILISLIGPLSAHNNLFLNGDAFFCALVTIDELEEAIANGDNHLDLTYSRLSDWTMLCGYLGYRNARVEGLQAADLKRLMAHLKALPDSEEQYIIRELEGRSKVKLFRVFIYNREFDSDKYRVGLRYNENWASYQRKHRSHAVYDEPGTEGAVIENWCNSEAVNPLAFVASGEYTDRGMGSDQAIALDWLDIKIIVPDTNDVDVFINRAATYSWAEISDKIVTKSYEKKVKKDR